MNKTIFDISIAKTIIYFKFNKHLIIKNSEQSEEAILVNCSTIICVTLRFIQTIHIISCEHTICTRIGKQTIY